MDMARTISYCAVLSSVVAGNGFGSGLSNQRALKSLKHQDLTLVDANFDWLDSPTIRFVFESNVCDPNYF